MELMDLYSKGAEIYSNYSPLIKDKCVMYYSKFIMLFCDLSSELSKIDRSGTTTSIHPFTTPLTAILLKFLKGGLEKKV